MSAAALPLPVVHRFFFALKPDDITARRTHAFAEAALGARGLLRPERHHVTLGLTEDMPTIPGAIVERLLRVGAAVSATPFDLVLDRMSIGYGTIVLRPSHVVRPLHALQSGIARAMAAEGLAMRGGWRFTPHETLCYRKAETAEERVIEGFQWQVKEFLLVHSYVGLHRHETIGRWPLQALEDPQGRLL